MACSVSARLFKGIKGGNDERSSNSKHSTWRTDVQESCPEACCLPFATQWHRHARALMALPRARKRRFEKVTRLLGGWERVTVLTHSFLAQFKRRKRVQALELSASITGAYVAPMLQAFSYQKRAYERVARCIALFVGHSRSNCPSSSSRELCACVIS